MERSQNWLKVKVTLMVVVVCYVCVVGAFLTAMVGATSKRNKVRTGISPVAEKSLVAIVQKDQQNAIHRNTILDWTTKTHRDTTAKIKLSTENNVRRHANAADKGHVLPNELKENELILSAFHRNKAKKTSRSVSEKMHFLRNGQIPEEDSTLQSRRTNTIDSKSGQKPFVDLLMQSKNGKRPTLGLRKITFRTKRDSHSVFERDESSSLEKKSESEHPIIDTSSDEPTSNVKTVSLAPQSETREPLYSTEEPSSNLKSLLTSTVEPDPQPSSSSDKQPSVFSTVLLSTINPEATTASDNTKPVSTASVTAVNVNKTDPSLRPSEQISTHEPQSNLDIVDKTTPQESEALMPSTSPSVESFPDTTSNQVSTEPMIPVTSEPGSDATTSVKTHNKDFQPTSPPTSTSSDEQPKSSVNTPTPTQTAPTEPKPRTTIESKPQSTTNLRTTLSSSTGLPTQVHGTSPLPVTNISKVQDVKERTSGSECVNGICDSANQWTDDAYWAFGSLMTVLLILTVGILYTGLLRKRNTMSNPISDVNCHAHARTSPSRKGKLDIKDLLKAKLRHIKNLNNSPLSSSGKDFSKHNGSSNGGYAHRYDRLPLLVQDEDEENEFIREWGPHSKEQSV